MKKRTLNSFIIDANLKHNHKYDYSKTEYVNSKTKVCIICPEHGEFWQTPSNHLNGDGCPKCHYVKLHEKFKKTTNNFIKKAKEIHGDRYDYSKVEYVNNSTKVCIVCPEHGEFWQTPIEHLKGCGCNKCAIVKKQEKFSSNNQEFIKKAIEIHGDKYDYSKVEYKNNHTKVCIVCPEHGEFWQTPNAHLSHNSCPKCKGLKISISKTKNTDYFIKEAKKVHGDKYIYSKVKYISAKTPVIIICPKHGEFIQTPDKHLYGNGCPKCANQQSNGENEIVDFLKNINIFGIKQRNREILSPYELDIYIPNKNVAIEYNGLIWHSERFNKDKNYHLNKTELCEKQGIRLIHIFEDEWIYKQDIVKSKLKHILGCDNDLLKIFARKCIIKEITNKEAMGFLEQNHIQGFVRSTLYLGCYYNNNLIGVMSFKKERNDSDKWELTRFATDITRHCVGIGGKLFTYFLKNYNPSEVKSFADRRWSANNDNLYIKLGFKLDKILKPDYKYVIKDKRYHKFNFRKRKLNKRYNLPFSLNESEMCKKLDFYRIYDCGLIKYIWNK